MNYNGEYGKVMYDMMGTLRYMVERIERTNRKFVSRVVEVDIPASSMAGSPLMRRVNPAMHYATTIERGVIMSYVRQIIKMYDIINEEDHDNG